ncbi:UPF0246 protein [Fulvitalea axinellae]|uniref:UPF0246 protein FUAX_22740 n=1 Tax=Fulvitalea axinellae TaxID=1182444 RepID=A0AAU9CSA2_9BACT|nr:UPF0246 protein [Fulvitalea axinellae]
MLAIISPSKGQNFDTSAQTQIHTTPDYLDRSQSLIEELLKLSEAQIGKLMAVSDKIAGLNYNRYRNFSTPFTTENAKPAMLAFTGDVYSGFQFDKFKDEDFEYAQQHLRIISGLYGLLRPMDLIQPYRLEMKTKLANPKGKDLYQFWGDLLAQKLEEAVLSQGDNVLVNLASNEYSKAVKLKGLKKLKVVTPVFKENKEGVYKVVALYAKKARGMMSDFIIREKISDLEGLKTFCEGKYLYNESLSTENEWVFTR